MRDDRVYLQHIRDAIDDITTYTSAGRDAFFADRMQQDATLRKLEVIGQAVKNLSDEIKSKQPHVPWKQIAGMRDKVIHDYFGVNLEIVWAVVEKSFRRWRNRFAIFSRTLKAGPELPRCGEADCDLVISAPDKPSAQIQVHLNRNSARQAPRGQWPGAENIGGRTPAGNRNLDVISVEQPHSPTSPFDTPMGARTFSGQTVVPSIPSL